MSFPFIQTLVLSFFDVLQYYVITNKLNADKLRFSYGHVSLWLVSTFAIGISSVSTEGLSGHFINALVLIAMSYFIYRRKGFQLLFLHIIGATIVLLIQLALLVPIYVVMGTIEYTFWLGLVAQSIALTIDFLIAKYLPLNYLFRFVETKNNIFRFVSLNVFILLTFCVIFWYLKFDGIIENLILISTIIVVILLINLLFLKEGLKNHVIEEQNRAYECYLPIVNELMEEIRVKQHDFNNHISALKGVLEQRKEAQATIDRVEDYIFEIENSFQDMDLMKMKNRIIAGFLYSKKKLAKESGVNFVINIENYQLATSLKDYELLDIMSILIDNAFETGVEENEVKVHFYTEKNKSVIEVSNKHPYVTATQINEFFTKGFSSKNAVKRGLGLYKLKQLVSGYQGEIEVLNRDYGENYIMFKVSLP